MRIYNRYILWLTALFMLTTVILSAYGQKRLDIYFSVYLIEYLVLTLLYVYFNPRARRVLNAVGYVLFLGFMSIVVTKVLEILLGIRIL